MGSATVPLPDSSVAVGVIEAEGFVAVLNSAEAMAKAAHVTVAGMLSLGSGIIAVTITGRLAHVVEAIKIGRSAIGEVHGLPVRAAVFSNPAPAVRAIALHLDEIE